MIAYVNKYKKVLMDNITLNSQNLNSYKITFKFQENFGDLTYYLVVKPIFDVPIRVPLDDTFSAYMPKITTFYGDKIGIGLVGEGEDIQIATDFFYQNILRGAV